MIQIGHGALGPPTSLTGGAALASVDGRSQHKLDQLAEKMKMKKVQVNEPLMKPYKSLAQQQHAKSEQIDQESKQMPTNEKDPLDWETLVGERLNRLTQLLRSEMVFMKLQALKKKIG